MPTYCVRRTVIIETIVEANSAREAEDQEFDLWCEIGGEDLPYVDPHKLPDQYVLLTPHNPHGYSTEGCVGIFHISSPARSEEERQDDLDKGSTFLPLRS